MGWHHPPLASILLLVFVVSSATEFMNNTAITTILMPILAATAVAAGLDPRLFLVPATLAASLAFMMPNGTAPNAIVFASGQLRVPFMARTGFAVNLVGVVFVTVFIYLIAIPTSESRPIVSLHGPRLPPRIRSIHVGRIDRLPAP